jgi:hypothetical protein
MAGIRLKSNLGHHRFAIAGSMGNIIIFSQGLPVSLLSTDRNATLRENQYRSIVVFHLPSKPKQTSYPYLIIDGE